MFFIIGVTLTTLAWPLPVHAQSKSELCQRANGLPAIASQYTQYVLDRAEAGLNYAQGSESVPDFYLYIPGWVRVVTRSVILWMDTSMRVHRQARDLAENTACLRFDLLLIECKMDAVREALEEALKDNSFVAILRLNALGRFLQNAFSNLTLGARDPTFKDALWHRGYIFDPIPDQFSSPLGEPDAEPICGNKTIERGEECDDGNFDTNDGCSPDCKNEMCPFHSDYLPPNVVGFGCTVEILDRIKKAYGPAEDEYEGLKKIMDQLDAHQEQINAMENTNIGSITGDGSARTGPPREAQKHRSFAGCARRVCEGNPRILCENDAGCSSAGPCISEENIGRCENNRDMFCTEDDECGESPCIRLAGTTVWELRGPFKLEKDQEKIMNAFRELRESEEDARSLPEKYKSFEDKPAAEGGGSQVQGLFVTVFRELGRSILQVRSKEQGRAESMIFAQASDGQQEIARALQPLRTAVSDFARTASEKRGGIREFVVNYAYFLRRTCMYRPCNKRLEWILKIALADECFPYTNGEFLSDSSDNPRWQKCEEKAKEE
ncbi:hypothetical protein A2635_04515 [Candidatus Peribacteria bacterium RIFCSPHIGHO2_01_FULL_51_9]|nr:MAG: hypothetical protein A2635_04515 [Candidatus Peribacteria bacterium RIFCSPHIGHO2_01_FULL_51_9]